MMEICVMFGHPFYNEDSVIVRLESVDEEKNKPITSDSKYGTTLRDMYKDGWILKTAIPTKNAFLLFLERSID